MNSVLKKSIGILSRSAVFKGITDVSSQHAAICREQKVLNQHFSTYKRGSNRKGHDSLFPPPPEHIDWRGENVLTSIKNQGSSGSCSIFAVVACFESVINCILKPKVPIELSLQHIMNRLARMRLKSIRSSAEANKPIKDVFKKGFTVEEVLRTLRKNGIPTKEQFKYTGIPLVSNANDWKTIPLPDFGCKYYIEGFKLITNDEVKTRQVLFKHPVIASVDASSWSELNFKEDKIHWGPSVPHELTNHAVLIVGCGIEKKTSTKYWIVRNTYGIDFGDCGYIKIERGKNCFGIESAIQYPVIDLDTLCS